MTNEKLIKSRIFKIVVVISIVLAIAFLTFNKGTISFNNMIEKVYKAEGDKLELLDNTSKEALPSSMEVDYIAYNDIARNYVLKVTLADTADVPDCELKSSDENIIKVVTKSTAWWIYTINQGNATLTLTKGTESVNYNIKVNASLTGLTIVNPINNSEYGDGLVPADSTIQLGLKTEPEGMPTSGVVWTSSDTDVIEVDQTGLVTTHVKTGKKVTITASNSKGTISDTVVFEIEKIAATGVTISSEKTKYTVGEEEVLKASYEPKGASPETITWSSSNKSAFTVDSEGKITAKGEGEATIKAVVDGSITSNELTLTARKGVESISLNNNSLELLKGQTEKLEVTYNPENVESDLKGVTYSSSNPEIVECNEKTGEITAKTTGVAEITATSTSNSSATARCIVNVTVPIDSISVEPNIITLEKDETTELNVVVTPEDTTSEKKFTYKSNNEDVVTVDETGKVTAIGEGETTIIVSHEASNLSTEVSVKVKGEETNPADDNTIEEPKVDPEPEPEPLEPDSKSIVSTEDSDVQGKIQFDNTVDPDWKVSIKKLPVTENLANANVVNLYDIKVVKEGVEVPIEGQNLKVTLQPDMNLSKYTSIKVAYVVNDELNETFNASYNGTYVTFNTNHLSEYAIIASETTENKMVADNSQTTSIVSKISPQTGDINVTLYAIAAIGSLIGITFIIRYLKDRK